MVDDVDDGGRKPAKIIEASFLFKKVSRREEETRHIQKRRNCSVCSPHLCARRAKV